MFSLKHRQHRTPGNMLSNASLTFVLLSSSAISRLLVVCTHPVPKWFRLHIYLPPFFDIISLFVCFCASQSWRIIIVYNWNFAPSNQQQNLTQWWLCSLFYHRWYFWHSTWHDRRKKCRRIGRNFARKFCGNIWARGDSSRTMFCANTIELVRTNKSK